VFVLPGFEKLQISVDIPVGDISAQQLISAGGQIFRNSNLTGSFPTPTCVKDGAAPHLAHIVCSALLYFQIKAALGIFENYLEWVVLSQKRLSNGRGR
jgi:hypothetical protein